MHSFFCIFFACFVFVSSFDPCHLGGLLGALWALETCFVAGIEIVGGGRGQQRRLPDAFHFDCCLIGKLVDGNGNPVGS